METKKEAIANNETRKHILNVAKYINIVIYHLLDRAQKHDETKFSEPELPLFVKLTDKLSQSTYGSAEHTAMLKKLKPALDHHYATNRHHPEHYPNGIEDMTLIDLVEMLCDWKASTLRHEDGNILKSIEINTDRFKINPQLAKILQNTVELFDHTDTF